MASHTLPFERTSKRLRSPALIIEDGAVFQGNCVMSEPNAKPVAIKAAN